jgi:hypothetical protein
VIDRVEEPFDVCNNGPCAAAIFNDLVMSTVATRDSSVTPSPAGETTRPAR